MEATFTQKGLEGGFADIILTLEEGESFAPDDAITLARESASGTEYLARDKGQWGGKKEGLRAPGTLSGNKVTFRLEPYYVNCLTKGGYLLTLVDAQGHDKSEADIYLDGVKKSAVGTTGYSLAGEGAVHVTDAAAEELAAVQEKITVASEATTNAATHIQESLAAQRAARDALAANDREKAQQAAALAATALTKAHEAKAAAAQALATADALHKSGKLALDAVKSPQAADALQQAQTALDSIITQLDKGQQAAEALQRAFQEQAAQMAAQQAKAAQEALEREAQEAAQREKEAQEAAQRAREAESAAAPAPAASDTAATPSGSKKGLIIGLVVLLLAGAGGAGYFLTRTPPAPEPTVQEDQAAKAKAERKAAEAAAKAEAEHKAEAERKAAEAAAKAEAERKAAEDAARARADAKGRVAAFFAGKRTPEGAMQLAAQLDAETAEQQDALFRLYYYATSAGNTDASFKLAQCIDPSQPAWGTIKKDAAGAWTYYGKHPDGRASRERMKAWLQNAANKGDANAQAWLNALPKE